MKTIVRNSMALAGLVVMMAVSACAQDGAGRLAGGWDTTVTIYNCTTGATIRTFSSVGTFNQGGTFNGITAGMSPAQRSPEIGVWRHLRGDAYLLRFKAFQFDAAGNPTVYQVVTHEVLLDQDNQNYISDGGVQFFNATTGAPAGTGCSRAVGTRMTLD